MQLLDIVILIRNLPVLNLYRGQVGTVVDVNKSSEFEVEFIELQGKTYTFKTLNACNLMRIHNSPLSQTAFPRWRRF